MAWLCVNRFQSECIFSEKPIRDKFIWKGNGTLSTGFVILPKGSIEKLIGRELEWSNEPVEI